MRSNQYQRYATGQFRWASCLVAVIIVGVAAAGCGSSSASNDGSPSGSGGGAATGTGGTVGGTGGKKVDGGGTGGSIIRPDAGVATGLGMPCTTSATCGAGLTCLLPTDKSIFGAAGPAHGYCTLPCAANGAPTAMADLVACDAAGGSCVDFALDANTSQAFCMLNCLQGKAPAGTMKCNGRGDVACETLGSTTDGGVTQDVCIPVCSQDSDCPTGRKCDERFSVCVDTPTAGAPLGTHCDPKAATSTCAGGCLPVGTGTTMYSSFCTRRCVFGFIDVCNWVPKTMSLATGGPHGVCVFVGANSDVGDEGFCSQQCDTPADCTDQTDPMLSCDTSITVLEHGFCAWGPRASADGGTD